MGTTGFSISSLLSNPNFQRLLAGIGSRLDPEGVGGALGSAADAYIANTSEQRARAGQENARVESNRTLGTRIGGDARMTPPGSEGLSSIKTTPKGSVILEYDPPMGDARTQPTTPQSSSQIAVTPPARPVQTPTAPTTSPTTSVPRPSSSQVSSRYFNPRDLYPFS